MTYAALDAAVLLMLLDSFIAAALPRPPAPPPANGILTAPPVQMGSSSDGHSERTASVPIGASCCSQAEDAAAMAQAADSTDTVAAPSTPECLHADAVSGDRAGSTEPGHAEPTSTCSSGSRHEGVDAASNGAVPAEATSRAHVGGGQAAADAEVATPESSSSSGTMPELAAALAAAQWGTRLEVGGSGGKALARKMPPKRSLGRRKATAGAGEEDPSFGAPPLVGPVEALNRTAVAARMLRVAGARLREWLAVLQCMRGGLGSCVILSPSS